MLKKNLNERKKHFKNNYSTEDMRITINNMSNIFNLLKSNENYDKISSKKILLMSNQIKNKIRKNFKIQKLDENDFSYLKNYSKKNSKKNKNKSFNNNFDLNENEFNLIDKNLSKDEIKNFNKNIKKFKQKEKIMKLKYEILIKDLKKKYNFNKTFEEKIEYKSFHFLREKNNKNNEKYSKLIKNNNNKNIFLTSNNKNNFLFYNQFKSARFSHKNIIKNNKNINNNFQSFQSFSSDFNNLNSQISTSSNENNFLTPNFSRNKKLIKNFSLNNENSRPFSTNNSKININNNFFINNNKIEYLKNKVLNKINNIQKIILTENENFKRNFKNDEKNYKNEEKNLKLTKNLNKKNKKKQNFNKKIEEINKEFGFENYNKKNLKYKEINEDEIVYKNQKNVEIKLDPNCKKILNEVVKKLKFDDFRFNRKFIDESLYEKKIFKIKQNSEMNNLAKFTTHLENKLKNKFFKFSNNETEENKINKNINKIIDNKRIDSEENINDIILRYNILKKIKPSLKLTRTYKRIYSDEDYQLLYKDKVEKERRKEKYRK